MTYIDKPSCIFLQFSLSFDKIPEINVEQIKDQFYWLKLLSNEHHTDDANGLAQITHLIIYLKILKNSAIYDFHFYEPQYLKSNIKIYSLKKGPPDFFFNLTFISMPIENKHELQLMLSNK